MNSDTDCVQNHRSVPVSVNGNGMNRIEAALPAEHVRIHRSAIVNRSRVRTLEALPNAELTVVLTNGVTLRASRSYADRLRLALGVVSSSDGVEKMK